ncbi:ZDHC6 Palmitoyltransferase, partial [Polypterus senegalus]
MERQRKSGDLVVGIPNVSDLAVVGNQVLRDWDECHTEARDREVSSLVRVFQEGSCRERLACCDAQSGLAELSNHLLMPQASMDLRRSQNREALFHCNTYRKCRAEQERENSAEEETAARCVMKMDHHCPWINNCCGHQNHAYFTYFLLLAPLGCIHASIVFIMTMYSQLYDKVSFGWSSVKIDMSALKKDQRPIIPFGLSAFAATLFALGLALGTTIAVGMLFFIQAKDRIQYYQTGEEFIFPYDMNSKWENFKQVFSWSGTPEGDGIHWPVRDKCHQHTLTIEQLKQKADKRVRSVSSLFNMYEQQRAVEVLKLSKLIGLGIQYRVIEDYNGAYCPLNKGLKTFFTTPCTEEPRIKLRKGETIFATRGLKRWMYGDKVLDEEQIKAGVRIRGWFPRRCVEKCLYDKASDLLANEEKKDR